MKNLVVIALLCTLVGCATSKSPVDEVKASMDKDQVLRTAGNPKYTYRSEDQDHWVYVFESNGRLFTKTVTFEHGKVTAVGRTSGKDDSNKELENASSMEEFEQKARAMQKSKGKGKFKNVDN